jgi:hypothetical protein
MIAKTFEIRDDGTFIPVLAVKLQPGCEADRFLLSRAGFGSDLIAQSAYVMVCRLNDEGAHSDPHAWDYARTMPNAHTYIIEHFDELESGDVVDVEFILGERATPKRSERAAA